MKNISAVILAAGEGTRMNSDFPKILHKMGNK
ncbi:MAG: 2-C-methyl-D-erythritol 4-phosphate cytidylyltransferase, partial [Candidatus Omnitrophica bacterium]|nr:2-C-methyl-D-erythritol 4-phosphate cytidylyltransferase [Candidatus Omnitrophota bacterium]